jgi:hypothetical protein
VLQSLLLASVSLAAPAFAQSPEAPPAPAPDAQGAVPPEDFHAPESNEIVVTGFRRSRGDILSGISVVAGDDLTRDLRPTIGETLSHQPGVSATSFGPNASRPVRRGFQGERVRLLTDGIGSLDAVRVVDTDLENKCFPTPTNEEFSFENRRRRNDKVSSGASANDLLRKFERSRGRNFRMGSFRAARPCGSTASDVIISQCAVS